MPAEPIAEQVAGEDPAIVLAAFHQALAGHPPAGFVASAHFRGGPAAWVPAQESHDAKTLSAALHKLSGEGLGSVACSENQNVLDEGILTQSPVVAEPPGNQRQEPNR